MVEWKVGEEESWAEIGSSLMGSVVRFHEFDVGVLRRKGQ